MKNLFILAKNSLFTHNSKNKFYIIMLILFCVLATVCSGIINGVDAVEKSFFDKDISNEVRVLGYYDGSNKPFYYSESAINKFTAIESVENYKLNYNLDKLIQIKGGGASISSYTNAVTATSGYFNGKGFVWGRDFGRSDTNSAIISKEKLKELTDCGILDMTNPVIECVIDGVSYDISVIGVFSKENYKDDIDFSSGGKLSQRHFILSGDIGRVVYEADFDKNRIQSELTLILSDSKLVPKVTDAIHEIFGNIYVISDYEFASQFIELFKIINVVVAVLLIVILLVTLFNVHDVFSILAKSNRYNYAVMMTQGYSRAHIVAICSMSFAINFVIALVIGLITGFVVSLIISASIGSIFSDYIGLTAFLPNAYLALMIIGILLVSLIDIAITVFKETRFDTVNELKKGRARE